MRRTGGFQSFEGRLGWAATFVRPFEVRQVLTVERIAPVFVDDDNASAIITWGAVGQVPEGVRQETPERRPPSGGFTVKKSHENEEWTQKGTPVTEEVALPPPYGDVFVKRVRRIVFAAIADAATGGSSSSNPPAMAGLHATLPANRQITASFETNWD